MATPTLKYVAPTTPEDDLPFAPEPVVIYGVPSGGGGGGAVDSVNGQTGVVELAVADIPDLQDELDSKAVASEVADFASSVSGQFTTVAGQIADKVNTADVAGLNTVGWARAVWIASGGTAPVGTPVYTIVIEA